MKTLLTLSLLLQACGAYCDAHPNASQCFAPKDALCNNLSNAASVACVVSELNKASGCTQFEQVDAFTLKSAFSGQLVSIQYVKAIDLDGALDAPANVPSGQAAFGAAHVGAYAGPEQNIDAFIQIVNDGRDDLLADTSAILAHELGHALNMIYNGSNPHSSDSTSLMFPSVQQYLTPTNLSAMANDLKADYFSCNGPWADKFKH